MGFSPGFFVRIPWRSEQGILIVDQAKEFPDPDPIRETRGELGSSPKYKPARSNWGVLPKGDART
jgi:hypothetical protein